MKIVPTEPSHSSGPDIPPLDSERISRDERRRSTVRILNHELSRIGLDFVQSDTNKDYMSEMYAPKTLQWIRFKVLFMSIFFTAVYDSPQYDGNGDAIYWTFRFLPSMMLLLSALTMNVKTPESWINKHRHTTLFSAVCFVPAIGYLSFKTLESKLNTISAMGGAGCSDLKWRAMDASFGESLNEFGVYLIVVVLISKHTFNLRFKGLLVLVPTALIIGASFVALVHNTLQSFGCGQETDKKQYGVINGKAAAATLVAFALFLYETRAHEHFVLVQYAQRIQLSERLVKLKDVNAESQSNVEQNVEQSNMNKVLNDLGGMAADGTVELLLQQALSLDRAVRDNATKGIKSYIASAKVVVPASAKAARELGRKRNQTVPVGVWSAGSGHATNAVASRDDQMRRRVAAAKTGLEVARAWITRIMGTSWDLEANSTVFLGGSCNPTTWRKDIAIPMLEAESIRFYNPQVENWTPDLVDIEAQQKEDAEVLLFVIGKETRSLASVVEAAEHIVRGRNVVLSLEDAEVTPDIKEDELQDLNRMRSYLRDVATRHAVPYYVTVQEAISVIVLRLKGQTSARSSVRSDRSDSSIATPFTDTNVVAAVDGGVLNR